MSHGYETFFVYLESMIGIDEVGRGCWAGPLLVVAARAKYGLPEGLTDSKLLSRKQRESIYELLMTRCRFGEGWVTAYEIDENGLANALRLGVSRALKNLKVPNDEKIIMDGSVNYINPKFINSQCIVDADLKIPIVSAASIYAKVLRDNFMGELSLKHPNYGFEKHVGYGTKAHRTALESLGIINGVHRLSFKPVAGLST
jgi:ribonuclease HII